MGFGAAKAADGMCYYGADDRHRFKVHHYTKACGSGIQDWWEVEWQFNWGVTYPQSITMRGGECVRFESTNPWCSTNKKFYSRGAAEGFAKLVLDGEITPGGAPLGEDGAQFVREGNARRTQRWVT